MRDLVGRTLGNYQIVQLIGQGGMATVYKGYQAALDRYVAIKILPGQLGMDAAFVERFRREALAAAQLRHPNIIVIHDVGSEQDLNFIVMELLEARMLDQILRPGQPLGLRRSASIIAQVASALDYAHSRGIVHRDVKPSNISVDESRDDHVTLMDFGLMQSRQDSRITVTGMIMGTPRYMAPEQAMGEAVDLRADVYALGIVLYELLTGQAPFEGDSPFAILRAHLDQAPRLVSEVNPRLPKSLDAVVLKALAKEPAQRYQSAGELALALEAGDLALTPAASVAGPVSAGRPEATQVFPSAVPLPAPARPSPRTVLADWLFSVKSSLSTLVLRVRPRRPRASQPSWPPADTFPPYPQPTSPATVETIPPSPIPEVPPSIVEMERPSLILRPHLHRLLDPIRDNTLSELLSEQEPERLIDYITEYEQGRFIITGYGSFGGSTLVRAIVDAASWEIGDSPGSESLLVVWFELADSGKEGSIFKASIPAGDQDFYVGQITTTDQERVRDRYPVSELLDVLAELMAGNLQKSSLAKVIGQAIGSRIVPSRLIIVLDKAPNLGSLRAFVDHPLFDRKKVSYLAIVEREGYDQWDKDAKRLLQRRQRFQIWDVPCLWESDHHLVERTMNLLFKGYRIDSPEMEEIRRAFDKHIAFVGRGAIGKTVRELQQLRYWRFDEYTKQPFVALERLDHELIVHNAWIQETLEANWELILGRNFPGRLRTDRAKQGVYALMDWITDCATFTLEEVLDQATKTRVIISPHKRQRDEVILRLLDVLVGNGYLQQAEDEFDIIWGRDITEGGLELAGRVTHAEEIASKEERVRTLEKRLNALLDDHQAASSQLSNALSEVERARLRRQIEGLEQEIDKVQSDLDSLHRAATVILKEESPEGD